MLWTPEMINKLISLWVEGSSSKKIGIEIRCSRNAVIGKAHRLHLPRHVREIPRPAVKVKPVSMPKLQKLKLKPPPKPPPAPKPKVKPKIILTGVTFADLRNGMCKWPLGEDGSMVFCGNEALLGKPYCRHHETIAYYTTSTKRSEMILPVKTASRIRVRWLRELWRERAEQTMRAAGTNGRG